MQIRWSRAARADLEAIAERIGVDAPDRLSATMLRIEAATAPLMEHPRAGAPISPDLRKWLVRKTPFLLLYRVVHDRVEIVRVQHSATDWKPH